MYDFYCKPQYKSQLCRKKLSGMFPEPPPSYDMAMAALYGQLEGAREHGETTREVCEGATASSHSADAAQPTPTNHLAATSGEAVQVLPVPTRIISSPSPPTQAA